MGKWHIFTSGGGSHIDYSNGFGNDPYGMDCLSTQGIVKLYYLMRVLVKYKGDIVFIN